MVQLSYDNVYADGTSCIDISTLKIPTFAPSEFTEQENEALFHEYLCGIAPLVEPQVPSERTPLGVNNVYADGTASIDNSPKINHSDDSVPSEFTEPEHEGFFHEYLCSQAPLVVVPQTPPLDFHVYADGTACIDNTMVSPDPSVPHEFTEPENEASFHEYLCNIAPPVVVKGDSNSKMPTSNNQTTEMRGVPSYSSFDQLRGA